MSKFVQFLHDRFGITLKQCAEELKAVLPGLGETITEDELELSDVTTGNASTSKHGWLKKLSGNAGEFLNGVGNWIAVAAGITNSAGANAIPKSDGTNLVASQITDDGSAVAILQLLVDNGSLDYNGSLASGDPGFGYNPVANHGVFGSSNDGDYLDILLGAVSVHSSATIVNSATTSITNSTSRWGTGLVGTEFQIDGLGKIKRYADTPIEDGGILIGETLSGKLNLGTLSAGTGISIANGAGSITIKSSTATALTFATLPAGVLGDLRVITDCNTVTWGANAAGGGSNKVLVWYNGTNWTVFGK